MNQDSDIDIVYLILVLNLVADRVGDRTDRSWDRTAVLYIYYVRVLIAGCPSLTNYKKIYLPKILFKKRKILGLVKCCGFSTRLLSLVSVLTLNIQEKKLKNIPDPESRGRIQRTGNHTHTPPKISMIIVK